MEESMSASIVQLCVFHLGLREILIIKLDHPSSAVYKGVGTEIGSRSSGLRGFAFQPPARWLRYMSALLYRCRVCI